MPSTSSTYTRYESIFLRVFSVCVSEVNRRNGIGKSVLQRVGVDVGELGVVVVVFVMRSLTTTRREMCMQRIRSNSLNVGGVWWSGTSASNK